MGRRYWAIQSLSISKIVCCEALTHRCEACKAGFTPEEWCEENGHKLDCPTTDKVTLYDEPNFEGESLNLGIGLYNTQKMESLEFYKMTSSLKVP